MLQIHREILKRNNYYLLIHLEIETEPNFLTTLSQSKILLSSHIEEITSKNSNLKMVECFLDILPKRGSKAYEAFLDALLASDQSYINAKLNQVLDSTSDYKEPIDFTDNYVDNQNRSDMTRIILIINNNEFIDELEQREGSEFDVMELQKFFVDTLQYALYNDKPFVNLISLEMMNTIKQFSNHISMLPAGQAVIVLMSHGKNNLICGCDGESLAIQMIFKVLSKNTDHICKAIIFSCCRGNIPPLMCIPESNEEARCDANPIINSTTASGDRQISILYGDFIPTNSVVLYSTQRHYLSYREKTGTVFVQSMLSVFRRGYKDKTLRDMMVEIMHEMRQLYKRYDQFPDFKENYFVDFRL